MRIRCVVSGLRTRKIWIVGEEFLCLSPIGWFLSRLFLGNPPYFLILTFIAFAFLEGVSRLILLRSRATSLKKTEAPWIYEILRDELQKQRIWFGLRPKVYWTPRNLRRSARVLGGFRSKIVLSGGFVVEAQKSPTVGHLVVRHELAHIKGGDSRIYFFMLILLGNTLWVLGDVLGYAWNWRSDISYFVLHEPERYLPLLQIPIWLFFLALLLRRREYLADARAVNASESASDYISIFIRGDAREKQGWFHPDSEQRAGAIQRDSPVLRASPFVIGSALLYSVFLVGNVVTDPNQDMDLGVAILFSIAFPLIAVLFELLKGWRTKIPSVINDPVGRPDLTYSI